MNYVNRSLHIEHGYYDLDGQGEVSKELLARLENGRGNPTLDTVERAMRSMSSLTNISPIVPAKASKWGLSEEEKSIKKLKQDFIGRFKEIRGHLMTPVAIKVLALTLHPDGDTAAIQQDIDAFTRAHEADKAVWHAKLRDISRNTDKPEVLVQTVALRAGFPGATGLFARISEDNYSQKNIELQTSTMRTAAYAGQLGHIDTDHVIEYCKLAEAPDLAKKVKEMLTQNLGKDVEMEKQERSQAQVARLQGEFDTLMRYALQRSGLQQRELHQATDSELRKGSIHAGSGSRQYIGQNIHFPTPNEFPVMCRLLSEISQSQSARSEGRQGGWWDGPVVNPKLPAIPSLSARLQEIYDVLAPLKTGKQASAAITAR